MRGWGAIIAIALVVLPGCETARTQSDVRDQGTSLKFTSAKPLGEALECLTGRINSAWSNVYPDPVLVEMVGQSEGSMAASLTIFKVARAKSVLHWENDPLWVFDLETTPNGTAIKVFEARGIPFYADTRDRRIKAAFQPCTAG